VEWNPGRGTSVIGIRGKILMTPAVAPRTTPDSLRGLLRSATADCHAAVDARFAPMVANGASRYGEFLSASARALWPLEPHGEGKPFWQTFLARLGSSIAGRSAPKRAVAGTMAAFTCFAGHLPHVHAVEAADAG
jgi:heme oxygenase